MIPFSIEKYRCQARNGFTAAAKQSNREYLGLLILYLTEHNNRAFTLVELTMAIAFSVLLLTGVYGFYTASSQSYTAGISGQNLQDGAGIVLSKIIEGKAESGVVYRLSTSVSYMIPNGSANELYSCGGSPQSSPCNAGNTAGEVYYCQDSPCTGPTDPTARWYYLNSAGTSVIYHHPASGGGTVEENIYTAPTGATMTLRFSPAAVGVPLNVIEIDVALSGWKNITGAASTFVLLRNHL